MADAMAGVAVYRNDHYVLAGELKRLQDDQAYKAAQRARELWQAQPALARRSPGPSCAKAKKKLT